jgi:AcrR family transcriptional regulator
MKGFSDERRTHIRRELLEEGRKLFTRYGLRKTTMADLTGPVDIAPSTFYQFFDSKEELYIKILEREGERFYERAVEPLEENADRSGR